MRPTTYKVATASMAVVITGGGMLATAVIQQQGPAASRSPVIAAGSAPPSPKTVKVPSSRATQAGATPSESSAAPAPVLEERHIAHFPSDTPAPAVTSPRSTVSASPSPSDVPTSAATPKPTCVIKISALGIKACV